MKQLIVCDACKKWWIDRCRNPDPEEGIKVVSGIAAGNYFCDNCNAPLEKGSSCAAVSNWLIHGSIPYYKWELDYIVVTNQLGI